MSGLRLAWLRKLAIKNADDICTYRLRQGYTGADSFSYAVSDGKLTATGSNTLTLGASQRDDDEDYRDIHYVVINSANSQGTASTSSPSSNGLAVNWQAGSTSQTIAASPPSQGNNWLNQLLSTDSKSDKNDISQKTGLKVNL